MTWNWSKRLHPQKGGKCVENRHYSHIDGRNWVFTDGSVTLFRMASIPIRRHAKVRGEANPGEPQDAAYSAPRHVTRGRVKALQDGPLKERIQAVERQKASLRARVEHPFHVIKNLFGHRKVRYRGLKKNSVQWQVLFTLSNLYLLRKPLLA